MKRLKGISYIEFALAVLLAVVPGLLGQGELTAQAESGAREVLVPAGIAHVLPEPGTRKSAQKDRDPDTLDLPFFDDFSRPGRIPFPEFWVDESVFVNNSYTRNPVTLGFGTLDAIDENGDLNSESTDPFESDFLTSVPINLDFPGREDIWLSFYYKPKGLGDNPESKDSLVVEFFEPDSGEWYHVWSVPGLASDDRHESDTFPFIQAWVPVNDSMFQKPGFQFRFKNYVTLPTASQRRDRWSNFDHWMIDYVYLDTGRTENITSVYDVSMISRLESLLKNYEAVPWRHFFPKAYIQEIKPTVGITYRNNDTIRRNATRVLKITDLSFNFSDSINGGATNVDPLEQVNFEFPYNYPFIFYDMDSTEFEIRSYLITEDLDYKWNDTVTRIQKFHNYYAYDDGTAEDGYGLAGEGSRGGKVACRFNNFKKDTLRGVSIFFNRTAGDEAQDFFILGIWDHDELTNGPGDLIHSMDGIKPQYNSELNQFFVYRLDTAQTLDEGIFYVGWIKTTESILNVGWDRWKNNNDKIYYSLGQDWQNSGFYGSLMIRPLFGGELIAPVSVPEVPAAIRLEIRVSTYPNPAGSEFYLDVQGLEGAEWFNSNFSGQAAGRPGWSLDLYNLQGKQVYSSPAFSVLGELMNMPHSIADVPEGLYIVQVNQDGIYRAGTKLMIAR